MKDWPDGYFIKQNGKTSQDIAAIVWYSTALFKTMVLIENAKPFLNKLLAAQLTKAFPA